MQKAYYSTIMLPLFLIGLFPITPHSLMFISAFVWVCSLLAYGIRVDSVPWACEGASTVKGAHAMSSVINLTPFISYLK